MNSDNKILQFLAQLEHEEQLVSDETETHRQDNSLLCPVCGKTMQTQPYKCQEFNRIDIDVCEEHGVWLDSGELPRIFAGIKAEARIPRIKAAKAAKKRREEAERRAFDSHLQRNNGSMHNRSSDD